METDDLMTELLNDYTTEAAEHIEVMQQGLLQLENCTDASLRDKLTESIYRETHSLKGASRVLNQIETEKICMCLESHFSILKKHSITLSTDYYNAYNRAIEMLSSLLTAISNNELKPAFSKFQQLVQTLEFSYTSLQKMASEQGVVVATAPLKTELKTEEVEALIENNQQLNTVQGVDTETIRIDVAKLNTIMLKTEDFVSTKNTLEHLSIQFNKIQSQLSALRSTLGKQAGVNDDFVKLKKVDDDLRAFNHQFKAFQNVFTRQTDDLQLDVKTILLHPIRSLFSSAPKLIRDISTQSSKKVKYSITGDSIDIDRRIIEELKDPIIHLLRNCVDHGIELPAKRLAQHKPEQGTIKVAVEMLENKKIQIDISDDGAGINTQKIIQKALKSNILTAEQAEQADMSTIHALIFKSGISTSDLITDISGRGLGMAIVEEKVLNNNGTIQLISEPAKGTTFRITIPQSLSVYKGILIKSAASYFSIPVFNVLKAIRLKKQDLKTVDGQNCLFLDNEPISVVDLSTILGLQKSYLAVANTDVEHALLIQSKAKKMILLVDKISGQFESVLKGMGSQLLHVENIAGLTVLGSGKLVPVLNVSELIKMAENKPAISTIKASDSDAAKRNRLLVAEDSITIRTMLRSYLESAGYVVKTAVDGMQAYEFLQQNEYDLVVSDVEMPRMNGFELTAKIRETKAYSQLPVILVTALETADDKQRGLEAGANAYIVKQSFEQSNLVETIKRLL